MEQKQHPIFVKYTRSWLHEVTGYSKGYLCRVATGKISLSRAFIERVCFKLQLPEEDLFLRQRKRLKSRSLVKTQ